MALADGHGGIYSIEKTGTSGLIDTYTITLADTTTVTFTVTNAKSITDVSKTGTSGLTDTYTITFNDSTSITYSVKNGRGISYLTSDRNGLIVRYVIMYNDGSSQFFTVTDGEKGDKGDNAYIHIKWASQEPVSASITLSDIPDAWIGIYWGSASSAPTSYTEYKWYKYQGEKGDTGAPATLESSVAEYMVSDSGTIIPSGSWSTSIPYVAQGKYLWTMVTQTFNSGNPVVSYSVSRMGMDGLGSVSSVNGISPDSDGNVAIPDAGDLETRLKSSLIDDAELHLGFYLDENGDLCQKED